MDESVSGSVRPDEPMQPVDDELAALTDALLRGEPPVAASAEAAPLLDVARRLDALIAPRTAPSPDFQRRLRTETEKAWATRARRRQTSNRRAIWYLAAAAAVILLTFIIVPASATFTLNLAGAAVEGASQPVEIPWRGVILLIAIAGIGVYWLYRRRPA